MSYLHQKYWSNQRRQTLLNEMHQQHIADIAQPRRATFTQKLLLRLSNAMIHNGKRLRKLASAPQTESYQPRLSITD